MKRREFFRQTIVTGGSLALTPVWHIWRAGSQKNIGVQLYSVREEINKDPLDTITRIGKIGYTQVEGFGFNEGKFFGLEPMQFAGLLKNSGIEMPSMHHGLGLKNWDSRARQLTDATRRSLDTFAEMDVRMVISPHIVKAQRNPEAIKKLAEVFNRTGEYCLSRGMAFGYHNHDYEFKLNNSRMIFDVLLQRTDPGLVQFELDIYWTIYAGQDPLDWMRKANGRVTALHIKDMDKNRQSVEVGEGCIDFTGIFASPEAVHVKYHIVELEHYKSTPFNGIETSYQNLRKLLAG